MQPLVVWPQTAENLTLVKEAFKGAMGSCCSSEFEEQLWHKLRLPILSNAFKFWMVMPKSKCRVSFEWWQSFNLKKKVLGILSGQRQCLPGRIWNRDRWRVPDSETKPCLPTFSADPRDAIRWGILSLYGAWGFPRFGTPNYFQRSGNVRDQARVPRLCCDALVRWCSSIGPTCG